MGAEVVEFKNKGMYQDSAISKSSDEFAFENVNIRITAIEDSTLFAVTNEKQASMIPMTEIINSLEPNCISYDNKAFTSEFYVYSDIEIELTWTEGGEEHIETLTLEKGKNILEYPINPDDNTEVDFSINPVSDSIFHYYVAGETVPEDGESTGSTMVLSGKYIGHCILGNYLVVFTTDMYNPEKDCIYRFHLSTDKRTFYCKTLYKGKLNFRQYHPIEAIGDYESEDIQKVYWVDGFNQPRFINISDSNKNIYNRIDTQFDFVSTIDKFPTVKIEKNYNGYGQFPAGVIQYFITYYNKFGAQSSIVWSSAVHYITFKDRGAKADEHIMCSFDIDISNLDHSFEYVRVYSAKRTSIDGPLEVNIVADLSITDKNKVHITDINANQVSVDPMTLYYLGGSDFIASTIEKKDNVLFMGNIKLNDEDITSEDKEFLQDLLITKTLNPQTGEPTFCDSRLVNFVYKCFSAPHGLDSYNYKSQLLNSSKYIKGFKRGETYRFAIQFQNAKGQWTSPVWIGDKKCNLAPSHDVVNNQIAIATVSFVNSIDLINRFSSRFKRYRILMAETSYNTRNILAQGVVSPTVFNLKERADNKPYSVASWVMRPQNGYEHHLHLDGTGDCEDYNCEVQCVDEVIPPINETIKVGSDNAASFLLALGFKSGHRMWWKLAYSAKTDRAQAIVDGNWILADKGYFNKSSWSRVYSELKAAMAEYDIAMSDLGLTESKFRNMAKEGTNPAALIWRQENPIDVTYDRYAFTAFVSKDFGSNGTINVTNKSHIFYIDSTVLTLHSPEITYDENNILDNSKLSFKIVGLVPIDSNYSDAIVDAASGYSASSGFIGDDNIASNSNPPVELITSEAYQDTGWNSGGTQLQGNAVKYRLYMWNKQGSIIGQNELDANQSEAYAKLKHKIFANSRFASKTFFFSQEECRSYPISPVSIFNSDELSAKVIDAGCQKLYYYGNYDKLVTVKSSNPYHIFTSKGQMGPDQYDPVRIKFKSTPHAVFASVNTETNVFKVLPAVRGSGEPDWSLESVYEDYELPNDITYPWGFSSLIFTNAYVVGVYKAAESADVTTLEGIKDRAIAAMQSSTTPSLTRMYVLLSDQNKTTKPATSYWGFLNIVYNGIEHRWDYSVSRKAVPSVLFNSIAIDPEKYTYKLCVDSQDNFFGDYTGITTSILKLPYSKQIIYTMEGSYQAPSALDDTNIPWDNSKPFLYLAELYREIPYNALYGGYDENAIENITWLPISDATEINRNVLTTDGDTYYQRWDCLKTYPYTEEDENSVVDITSFMVETHINIDGRCDVNRGNVNIINARPSNFGLLNRVYSQNNNIFTYNVLDDKYDLSTFTNQIVWSLAKSPTADLDAWTGITLANTLNVDGNFGPITEINKFNETLLVFQERAISSIDFNNKTQITTEQGIPIELANSGKVDGTTLVSDHYGLQDRNAIVSGKAGMYFLDSYNKAMMKIGKDGIVNLGLSGGMSTWFHNNLIDKPWSVNNKGAYRLFYDEITNDVYISNNQKCLLYNEQLETFTSFMTIYKDIDILWNMTGDSYYFKDVMYRMFAGDYSNEDGYSITYRINPEPFIDKTFTNAEFIADYFDEDASVNAPEFLNRKVPFETLTAWNEYQYGSLSLEESVEPSDIKQKFRVWRVNMPRDDKSRYGIDRLRNPWIFLKLGASNHLFGKMEFHNLIVKYFK